MTLQQVKHPLPDKPFNQMSIEELLEERKFWDNMVMEARVGPVLNASVEFITSINIQLKMKGAAVE